MKRRSIFLVAALLMVAATPIFYYNFYLSTRGYFDKDVEFRKRVLAGHLQFAQVMVETKQEDRLMRILDDGIKVHMFDWYLITAHGEPVLFNPPEMANFKFPEIDGQLVDDEDKVSGTVLLQNKTYLTIGINKRWIKYFEKIQKRYFATTIEENAISIIIVLSIFAFLLKDILGALKDFKAGKGTEALQRLHNKKALTSEGKVFSEVMQGYQHSVDRLAIEKDMYAAQVLPSIRSELTSGRKPPYEFDCVMVRTDINHYSQMFMRGNRNVLTGVIHRFFSEASKIVFRYGGYMHEFIGDELIYYLKDEEHLNSVSMALSCILEIQEAAERYQSEIQQEYQMPFTIKSSLAIGKLRYGPLVNGLALMGPPLIESVRILSLVDERNRSQVYLPENVKERADSIFGFEEKGSFRLKGYSHERQIFELVSRRSLSSLLADVCGDGTGFPQEEIIPLLACFRKVTEVHQVLVYLQELRRGPIKLSAKYVLRILGHYRDLYLGESQENIDLGEDLMALVLMYRQTSEGATITPTLIRLMSTLLSRQAYSQKLRDFFVQSLDAEFDRGVANTLETYGFFENINVTELYERFKDTGSPRVVGNILMLWGQQAVGKKLCNIFRERLRSANSQIVASSLYAYGEILQYWGAQDLVFIRAQVEFMDLEKDLRAIAKNEVFLNDEAVQRQILRARASYDRIMAGVAG